MSIEYLLDIIIIVTDMISYKNDLHFILNLFNYYLFINCI